MKAVGPSKSIFQWDNEGTRSDLTTCQADDDVMVHTTKAVIAQNA